MPEENACHWSESLSNNERQKAVNQNKSTFDYDYEKNKIKNSFLNTKLKYLIIKLKIR